MIIRGLSTSDMKTPKEMAKMVFYAIRKTEEMDLSNTIDSNRTVYLAFVVSRFAQMKEYGPEFWMEVDFELRSMWC